MAGAEGQLEKTAMVRWGKQPTVRMNTHEVGLKTDDNNRGFLAKLCRWTNRLFQFFKLFTRNENCTDAEKIWKFQTFKPRIGIHSTFSSFTCSVCSGPKFHLSISKHCLFYYYPSHLLLYSPLIQARYVDYSLFPSRTLVLWMPNSTSLLSTLYVPEISTVFLLF